MALSLSHVSALSTASRAQRQGRRQWLRFPRGSGRLPEQSDTTAWVAAAQQRRCSCNAAEDVARLGATSRRELVSAVTLLGLGCVGSGQAAHATYVEEERATSVFDGAQSGVVSLANYVISSEEETAEGVGSGIVWDKLGHVITNYHCIAKLANDRTGSQVIRTPLRPSLSINSPVYPKRASMRRVVGLSDLAKVEVYCALIGLLLALAGCQGGDFAARWAYCGVPCGAGGL
jgi:hypothetical protein